MRKVWVGWCASAIALQSMATLALDKPAATEPSALLIKITKGRKVTPRAPELSASPVDRLRGAPEVSLSRMGGAGTDPVVRGMSQDRVSVLLDGIEVPGACPNRMDPPSSRISTAVAPELDVQTHTRTLRWGPLYGGQIIASTPPPSFAEGTSFSGNVSLGGHDNGDGKQAAFNAAVGSPTAFIRGGGSWTEADNYEDGDGNDVRSAFTRREGRIDGAWQSGNGVQSQASTAGSKNVTSSMPAPAWTAPKPTPTSIAARSGLHSPPANGR